MTISARTRYVAEVGDVRLIADRNDDKTVTIHGDYGSAHVRLDDPDGIDAMIELLHALKSERSEVKRLAEVAPHEEIIAVDEPTA